jgi:AcrR family transcriptional regulator
MAGMGGSSVLPKRRVGGRSARVRRNVLDATLVELAESGYGGLSVEAVARRAGVHKTTVYRQWPDRERLVTEALMQISVEELPLPDTGDLEADLRALAMAVAEQISHPRTTAVIRALIAAGPQLPAFGDTARSFWAARFALTGAVIRRAIERGELPPDTDVPMVLESLIAPLYLRLLVTGGELSERFVVRSVDLLLHGLTRPASPPGADRPWAQGAR